MAKQKRVAIFGAGSIGSEVERQVTNAGYQVAGIIRRKSLLIPRGEEKRQIDFKTPGNPSEVLSLIREYCDEPHAALFALPSGGDGTTELNYMQGFLPYRKPCISAGKSAFANQFEMLQDSVAQLGYTASVGGGTRILPFLLEWLDFGKPFVVDLVVNGTLSKIMSDIWMGRSVEAAVREAVDLKYAEPPAAGGVADPLKLFDGEIEDVCKKLTIILNFVFGHLVGIHTPSVIDMRPMTTEYLYEVTAQNARMKFVARMDTLDRPIVGLDLGAPGSISTMIPMFGGRGQIFVKGGFCHIPKGSPMDHWVPDDGPGNAVRIDQGGFPLLLSGEGAGPEATVGTMMKDLQRLCPLH